ncbi:MAG: transketolase [Solirubrobacteraceae bacterium]|nr:transketolase [Solirubrobacteraceae bacterium]
MPSEGSVRFADAIRRTVIVQSKRAYVGHIGSSLSIADLVAVVFHERIRLEGGADRDRFVLSKGHAALALYAALDELGRLPDGAIDTYCADGSQLGVHPEIDLEGIDFASGSLGQGLSIATGAALAARVQGSDRKVYVVLSDAELNEGNVWEAIMFAGHHRLENLVLLIDLNGQQALDFTPDVLDLGDVAAKLASFGWDAAAVPGHDHDALGTALDAPSAGKPRAIVAQTTFGYGVSYMESEIKWHYLPLSDELFADAQRDLAALEAQR